MGTSTSTTASGLFFDLVRDGGPNLIILFVFVVTVVYLFTRWSKQTNESAKQAMSMASETVTHVKEVIETSNRNQEELRRSHQEVIATIATAHKEGLIELKHVIEDHTSAVNDLRAERRTRENSTGR